MGLSTPAIPEPSSMRVARRASRVRADLMLAGFDATVAVAAYVACLLLRFNGSVPSDWWGRMAVALPAVVLVPLAVNRLAGLYGQVWRHASVTEARRIALASLGSTLLLVAIDLAVGRLLPLSIVLLSGLIMLSASGALRFQERLFAFQRNQHNPAPTRIVVLGAGNAGGALVREMQRDQNRPMVPVVVLDDDPRLHGRSLAGVPIAGSLSSLPDVARAVQADGVVMAIPSGDHDLVRRCAGLAEQACLPVRVLPPTSELMGEASLRDVRDLKIEDLLGRAQVVTDLDAVGRLLQGKTVLITGAGGSIGSEIARQVAEFSPGRLLILDSDETHLHDCAARLTVDHEQVLADIRETDVIDHLFDQYRPDVVFHAAALKHVVILEDFPGEAVRTNIVGTQNLVRAAARIGVERFVFISTDKAVRPSSVMGSSKAIGEQIVLGGTPAGASWCAVRFGNVLGSRGSVIPTFARQIAEGGPVTVRDPRMTRFFMSVTEAVQLVLQAATFVQGPEIFMLDMGEPVRIIDLAERMIRLTGREPGADVPVKVTGILPGEKLAEELRAPDEDPQVTPHPGIVRLRPTLHAPGRLQGMVSTLVEAAIERNDDLGPTLLDLANGRGDRATGWAVVGMVPASVRTAP